MYDVYLWYELTAGHLHKPNKMDLEFIEEQITSTKEDQTYHQGQFNKALATQEGLEAIEGDFKEQLVRDARENVKWFGKRLDYDANMLDVLYTARDLTKK